MLRIFTGSFATKHLFSTLAAPRCRAKVCIIAQQLKTHQSETKETDKSTKTMHILGKGSLANGKTSTPSNGDVKNIDVLSLSESTDKFSRILRGDTYLKWGEEL